MIYSNREPTMMYMKKIRLTAFIAVCFFLLWHSYSYQHSNSNSSSLFDSNLRPNTTFTFPDISFSIPRLGFAAQSLVSSAKKCDAPIDIPVENFMSMFGEDKKLMEWFGGICGGKYLELGGFDGMQFSNSYVFNKALGWKGVLVELRDDVFPQMVTNRPDEIAVINAGVCDKPQTMHAVYVENLAAGGIYEYAGQSLKNQWWQGIDLENDHRVHTIECNTLDNLLLLHAPEVTHFDFLSVDVIGSELAALRSIDFDRTQFGIILVAIDYHSAMEDMAIRQLLFTKGYSFISAIDHNYWFANVNFNDMYQHLIYNV